MEIVAPGLKHGQRARLCRPHDLLVACNDRKPTSAAWSGLVVTLAPGAITVAFGAALSVVAARVGKLARIGGNVPAFVTT